MRYHIDIHLIKEMSKGRTNTSFIRSYLNISFYLIVVIFIIYFFYKPLLNNWFVSDDLYLMWASAKLKIHEIFFVPEKHRMLSSNFNPMYGLSFKIDWLLFKMNATGYAIHCIISTISSSLMLFLLLKLFVKPNLSFLGAVLFLLNPLTINMTGLFFRRHYTEGLFFALLSLYLFIVSEKKEGIFNGEKIFSSSCYLISSLYRELYVILPAIAFLISKQSKSWEKFKSTIFYWIGLIIYSIWRLSIWKGIGGYPSNQSFLIIENFKVIPKILNSIANFWFPNFNILGYFFIFILVLYGIKHLRFFIIFLVLFIPIIPVSNIISYNPLSDKYYFHIVVFILIIMILLIENPLVNIKNIGSICALSLSFYFLFVFIKYDIFLLKSMNYESKFSKDAAMEYMYSNKPFIEARKPYWFYIGLKNINQDIFKKIIKTEIVPPDEFLKYSNPNKLKEIRESGINLNFKKIVEEQNKFVDKPIHIKMMIDGYKFSWEFGPFKDKTYTLLRSPVSGLYYNKSELRHRGIYMLPKESDQISVIYLKIIYRIDGGKEIVSPEFEIKFPGKFMIDYKN